MSSTWHLGSGVKEVCRDHGKENGNYSLMTGYILELFRYVGIMEKRMATTIL